MYIHCSRVCRAWLKVGGFSLSVVRFAHLISVDFFSDLMSVLHSLAEAGVSVYGGREGGKGREGQRLG